MIKKRLIELLAHAKKYIVYNVLLNIVALLVQIKVIFAITELIRDVVHFQKVPSDDLSRVLGLMAAAVVVRVICDRLASKASYMASVDVKRILRDKIYSKLLRLGVSYRDQVATSEVVQMSTEGVEQLETYFGLYLPQFFYSLIAPLILFAALHKVSLKASLVLLVCVPLIPLSIVAVQKFAKKMLSKYWDTYASLGDSFLENLQGMTTLKIYQADARMQDDMDREAELFRKVTMKVLTMQLNSISVMDIVAYGGAGAGMITAVKAYAEGQTDFAGALAIILLAAEFFIPLRLLGSYFHIAMNGMAASDKIFNLLDLPEPPKGQCVLENVSQNVAFNDVHFAYEEEGRDILKGVDFLMPVGSFVSLVGQSGCGKSTIAGLLSGRKRGYRGSIKVGDVELRDIQESSLLEEVTLVGFNSYIFPGSVRSNLLMAGEHISDDEMLSVLEKVNLLAFLEEQEGLDTVLSENASNLSGGQKQRLALARALLRDTPVYIFDEATSNIDAESEDLIMQVIRELAKTKTVLLISHRLLNVVDSDAIYLLEEGRIKESGTHTELLNANGSYAHLFRTQQTLENYGEEAK